VTKPIGIGIWSLQEPQDPVVVVVVAVAIVVVT
jgi:hypothetical protein